MKQILQNLGNGVTTIEDVPAPGVRAGQLLIRTSGSLVSAGTQRMDDETVRLHKGNVASIAGAVEAMHASA